MSVKCKIANARPAQTVGFSFVGNVFETWSQISFPIASNPGFVG
jgi:hypothetical protein